MLTSICRSLCLGAILLCSHTSLLAQQPAPELTPPIAIDGRVEVDEIRIERVRVSDASPPADLTNMRLALWVDVKDPTAREFLVRILKLEPVIDDTGKLLSTRQRRHHMPILTSEVRGNELKTFRGRHGPVIRLLLDAPARSASRIKRLKGQIEVLPSGRKTITLDNLPSLVDKQLKHDLLTETNVVPRIERDDDVTEVTLEITGRRDRLIAWTVARNGKPLRAHMESESAEGDAVKKWGQGFRRLQPDESTSLLIAVTTAGQKQVIDFEFSDLELP